MGLFTSITAYHVCCLFPTSLKTPFPDQAMVDTLSEKPSGDENQQILAQALATFFSFPSLFRDVPEEFWHLVDAEFRVAFLDTTFDSEVGHLMPHFGDLNNAEYLRQYQTYARKVLACARGWVKAPAAGSETGAICLPRLQWYLLHGHKLHHGLPLLCPTFIAQVHQTFQRHASSLGLVEVSLCGRPREHLAIASESILPNHCFHLPGIQLVYWADTRSLHPDISHRTVCGGRCFVIVFRINHPTPLSHLQQRRQGGCHLLGKCTISFSFILQSADCYHPR
jgi:hypothetical protein